MLIATIANFSEELSGKRSGRARFDPFIHLLNITSGKLNNIRISISHIRTPIHHHISVSWVMINGKGICIMVFPRTVRVEFFLVSQETNRTDRRINEAKISEVTSMLPRVFPEILIFDDSLKSRRCYRTL